MENIADQCIGVFDSGVGGLTVVRAVMQALPQENIIYLGDTARVPYGNRSAETIIRYSQDAIHFLLQKRVKMILVACNTASAAALPLLEKETPVSVLGAVFPGARTAAQTTQSGNIGVIATVATIRSGAYPKAISSFSPQARVFSLACPLFVPIIEEGWIDRKDPLVIGIVSRYLEKLYSQSKEIDTLALACTHYPLIAEVIQDVSHELWGHPVTLVDSASAMAEATRSYLTGQGFLRNVVVSSNDSHSKRTQVPLPPQLQCFVTDEAKFEEVGSRFLGFPIPQVIRIDL